MASTSYLAILLGVGVCTAFGALNGGLITRIQLPPFIVTLGTLNIAFALTHIYSQNQTVTNVPETITFLGNTVRDRGDHHPLRHRVDVRALSVHLVRAALYGRRPPRLRRRKQSRGGPSERHRFPAAPARGLHRRLVSSTASPHCVLVGRTNVGNPNEGQTDNLASITAVVLGGTSLFGGRGRILGTLVGVLIVGVFRNGLQLIGVDSVYQILVTGILVILAVTVDQFARRRQQ